LKLIGLIRDVNSIWVREIPSRTQDIEVPKSRLALITKLREAVDLRPGRVVPDSPPEVKCPVVLTDLLSRINAVMVLGREVNAFTGILESVEKEMARAASVRVEMERVLGRCPTCGKSFEPGTVHSEGISPVYNISPEQIAADRQTFVVPDAGEIDLA
jgi:hypothetical protein